MKLLLDTEIDWETYMYQIELFVNGERDYALISGPTGPLVYVFFPAVSNVHFNE